MNYDSMDFDKFSDWQQVLSETNNSLTYEQCLKINQYIVSYQNACLRNNSKHVMPKHFQEAANRLNQRIQHHESIKKPFLQRILFQFSRVLLAQWLVHYLHFGWRCLKHN